MSPYPDHPLVRAYLDELDGLLRGLGPQERAEIVGGVREHLDGLLPEVGAASDAEVRAALAELGPAAAVAEEAYAGWPATSPVASAPVVVAPVPVSSRPWLPWTVAGLLVLAALFVLGAMGGATGSGSAEVGPVVDAGTGRPADGGTVLVSGPVFDAGSVVATALAAAVTAFPLWLPLVVLVGTTGLWRLREKVMLVALVPLAPLVVAAVAIVAVAVLGQRAAGPGGAVGLAGGVLLVLVVTVVMVRRALRRADALASRLVAQPRLS